MKRSATHRPRCLAWLALWTLIMGATGLLAQPTVSIYDIQSDSYSSGYSMWAGQEVTITGVVTATLVDGYVVAEAPGPWQSIFVYSILDGPEIGDAVQLSGTVWEYYSMTEIEDVTSFTHLSSGNPVLPTPVGLDEVSSEPWESVLVTVEDVFVGALLDYGEWAVSDGSSYLICDQYNDYSYFPALGDELDSLTGVVFYSYGDFKLEPRFTADVVGEPIPHYALHGHVVTMNDERDVLVGGYVEILGDQIVDIHDKRPRGLPIVNAGGLIFPGLIDTHNHAAWNVLGPIPFTETFGDRSDWRNGHPLYEAFKDQRRDILYYGDYYEQRLNVLKLAEVRALVAGTTTMQGINCNGYYDAEFAHQGVVIDNLERFPARVSSSVDPLLVPLEDWQQARAEYWDRFVIHLSEGTSADALLEFYTVYYLGFLDERVTIIHGVPYGPTELWLMAQAGSSLVWSPVSNLALYGETANIPAAIAAGVNVALGPDWTPSGSMHLLDEMKAADAYDDATWGDAIDAQMLAEMVTRNAALAGGVDHLIGRIAPGYRANLMVVPGSPRHPYEALLRADPADVKLTVVSGRPMYGNPDTLAHFDWLGPVEPITLGGHDKALAIQVDNHGIPDDDKPFLETLAELEKAYAASDPKVCDFAGLE